MGTQSTWGFHTRPSTWPIRQPEAKEDLAARGVIAARVARARERAKERARARDKTRKSGSLAPSSDVSSRTAKSVTLMTSTTSPCPSRSTRSLIFFLPGLKDEVMKIMPVQKQTTAGQRTRFKAFVVVGDNDGRVGLGVKSAKEVATAIRGAIIAAKINVIPVMRGYWGNKIGDPHTIPCKVSGKCGSIKIRLIPAPRGTGIVAAPVPKKVLRYAGVNDCFTSSRGATSTGGNFVKAVFAAIKATYGYNMPEIWQQADLSEKKPPFQEFTDHLKHAEIKAPVGKTFLS